MPRKNPPRKTERKKPGRKPGVPSEKFRDKALKVVQLIGYGAEGKASCRVVGLNYHTFSNWYGKDEQFRASVIEARKHSESQSLHLIGGAKDWKAHQWLLSVQQPARYGPQIRVTLEREFGEAVSRLEGAFGDQPELLVKILDALTERGGGTGQTQGGPESTPEEPHD
jgi:hypothetical protein